MKSVKEKQFKCGFTLIELLVVISIIGLFSTFSLIALDNSRKKARDARRLADIREIQQALDLYYDKYNQFPLSSAGCNATIPNGGWCNSIESLSGNHWIREGTVGNLGEFLAKDPLDPKPSQNVFFSPLNGGAYFFFSAGYGGPRQWYMIVFGLEDHSNPIQTKDGVRACDGTMFHYGNDSNGVVTIGRDCQK